MSTVRIGFCVFAMAFAGVLPCPGQGCSLGDDGFDAGCCNFAPSVLPNLPPVSMLANWAELVGCGAQNQTLVQVSLTAPVYPYCDYAVINAFVQFPSGETMSGLLAAKYARTFLQIPAPTGQIWRFLINGDFTCNPAPGTNPCATPLPRCAFIAGQQVHFEGHVDYYCDMTSSSGAVTASLSLSHHQGCFTHAPWSCMPNSHPIFGHQEASWHLVGPAPFTFSPAFAPQGPLVADAVRTSVLRLNPFFYACMSETKVGPFGAFTPGAVSCLCATVDACTTNPVNCSTATACYVDQSISYMTCCPSGASFGPFSTVPIGGTPLAATGMVALKLGVWGALPQYPSGVALTHYIGVMTYSLPAGCGPQPNWGIHVAVGVATSNFLAMPYTQAIACLPPAPPSTSFIDLQNVLPLNSSVLVPGYGCFAAADVVWSFNTP
jgi:hypothetical protein